MAKRPTSSEYRRFISERGLAGSFRSYKRLKNRPKRRIEVHQRNIDGSVRRRRVYVLKENGKTVFRDFQTMQVLATTKKTIPKAISALHTTKTVKGGIKVRTWKVNKSIKKGVIELKNTRDTYYLKNGIERRHRVSHRPPRKMGFVIIDATYVSSDGKRKRVQIRSSSGYLGSKTEREYLIVQAIENGSRLAGFSPVEVILNDVWYEWIRDRRL